MPATLKDIAREVGVSTSTVSRALSAPGLVNAGTRERIEQVASTLGYAPNRAARGLTTGRTGNIGLVVTDLTNPFFPSIVKGVQDRARDFDLSVLLTDTGEDPLVEAGLVRALSRQVDGIVLCTSRMSDGELRRAAGGTALVLLNRRRGGCPR